MDVIIEQYFDFSIMDRQLRRDHRGLLADDPALDHRRSARADLGAGPRAAPAASRQGAGACARGDDRLHRRVPRYPHAAGPAACLGQPRRVRGGGCDPAGHRDPELVRQARPLLVRDHRAHGHLRRLHGRGLPRRDRGGAARADGGGSLARDEPRSGDASGDRPPGGAQGDSAAAERLHRPDEGHLAGQRDRLHRGRPGRARHPVGDLQQLGPDARRDPVPAGDHPAGATRRHADRSPAGAHLADRRWRGHSDSHSRDDARPAQPGGPSDAGADAEARGGRRRASASSRCCAE